MFTYTISEPKPWHFSSHRTYHSVTLRAFLHMKWIRKMFETNNLNFKCRAKILAVVKKACGYFREVYQESRHLPLHFMDLHFKKLSHSSPCRKILSKEYLQCGSYIKHLVL